MGDAYAASRYVERVKPGMELRKAMWELGLLCSSARRVEKPEWAGDDQADLWLEISDGIVVAVAAPADESKLPSAVTVLVRCGMPSWRRRRQNVRKAQRAHARRLRNRLRTGRPGLGRDFALSDDS